MPLVIADYSLACRLLLSGQMSDGNDAVASEETVMETFAPEFSRFWLHVVEQAGDRREDREDEARRQQQALEELAERVTAARSVV